GHDRHHQGDAGDATPIDLEGLPLVVVELLTAATLDGKPVKKRGPAFARVRYEPTPRAWPASMRDASKPNYAGSGTSSGRILKRSERAGSGVVKKATKSRRNFPRKPSRSDLSDNMPRSCVT